MRGQFNTGRQYRPEGQIIRWVTGEIVDDEYMLREISFWDLSRGITGRFVVFDDDACDAYAIEKKLMRAYDENTYSNIGLADWTKARTNETLVNPLQEGWEEF